MSDLNYIKILPIPGDDQPADIGTKVTITTPTFLKGRDLITKIIDFSDDRKYKDFNKFPSIPLS